MQYNNILKQHKMVSQRTIKIFNESSDTTLEMFDWIKARREQLGVSQLLLAEMSGVDRSYISQIENGHREGISIQYFARLVFALNAEISIKENN